MSEEDYKIAYENVMIANKMLEQENKQLKSILTELEEWLKSRVERVPETMAEVYEDKFVLDRITELKEKYK